MFSEKEYTIMNFIDYESHINEINQNRKPEIWNTKEMASLNQISPVE